MRFFSSRYDFISINNRIKAKNEKGNKKEKKKKKRKQDTLIGITVKIIVIELVYSMFIFAAKTQDYPI